MSFIISELKVTATSINTKHNNLSNNNNKTDAVIQEMTRVLRYDGKCWLRKKYEGIVAMESECESYAETGRKVPG